VTVKGPEGSFSVTAEKPFARIGAHETADVVLPGNRIPRRGIYLHLTEQGVFWINLASSATNGEFRHGLT
jgi:hypothetical protein